MMLALCAALCFSVFGVIVWAVRQADRADRERDRRIDAETAARVWKRVAEGRRNMHDLFDSAN